MTSKQEDRGCAYLETALAESGGRERESDLAATFQGKPRLGFRDLLSKLDVDDQDTLRAATPASSTRPIPAMLTRKGTLFHGDAIAADRSFEKCGVSLAYAAPRDSAADAAPQDPPRKSRENALSRDGVLCSLLRSP